MNRILWKLPMWAHTLIFHITGWTLVAHIDGAPDDVTIDKNWDRYVSRLEWKRNYSGDN